MLSVSWRRDTIGQVGKSRYRGADYVSSRKETRAVMSVSAAQTINVAYGSLIANVNDTDIP